MAQQEIAAVEMDDNGDGTNWNELDTGPCLVGLGLGVAVPLPLERDAEGADPAVPDDAFGDIDWHDDMIWSGYLQ